MKTIGTIAWLALALPGLASCAGKAANSHTRRPTALGEYSYCNPSGVCFATERECGPADCSAQESSFCYTACNITDPLRLENCANRCLREESLCRSQAAGTSAAYVSDCELRQAADHGVLVGKVWHCNVPFDFAVEIEEGGIDDIGRLCAPAPSLPANGTAEGKCAEPTDEGAECPHSSISCLRGFHGSDSHVAYLSLCFASSEQCQRASELSEDEDEWFSLGCKNF